MLSRADTNPKDVLPAFTSRGMAVAFLSPTATGLSKSILDTTIPLRALLCSEGIHDFEAQGQGPSHKVQVETLFVHADHVQSSLASLYRPETKSGDPRIWFSGLRKYAQPGNLLAILSERGRLFVANMSDPAIRASIECVDTPLGALAASFETAQSPEAQELLDLLKVVARQGFVRTIRSGDTGVGATLESLLGIAANSSKLPDFKGIELKASRREPLAGSDKNRVTLFSQAPDWKISPVGTARKLLDEVGYVKDGRRQLYCTLDATKVNSQQLTLVVDAGTDHLKAARRTTREARDLLVWAMAILRERLAEKHPESFWVKAEVQRVDGVEHFRYYKAVHTMKPITTSIDYLLDDGTVTVDLTISEKPRGVRDHGYLFKIWPEDFLAIFPRPRHYELCVPNP